jgi:hypothetical protein
MFTSTITRPLRLAGLREDVRRLHERFDRVDGGH